MEPDFSVKIVIPIYKIGFSETEEISFSQCLRILWKHSVIIIKPEDLDISFLTERDPNMEIQSFPATFFKGIEGYNKLMLSSLFYERFLDTNYILIYQLDAFVFKDELMKWVNKGYDYMGASWIVTPHNSFFTCLNRFLRKADRQEGIYYKVGNGGFSLRKTRSLYQIAKSQEKIIQDYLNAPEKEAFATEDVFWSLKAPEFDNCFRIPNYTEAIAFSMGRKPELAMKINNNQLPFGCHGFQRPKVRRFWNPIIKREFEKNAKPE